MFPKYIAAFVLTIASVSLYPVVAAQEKPAQTPAAAPAAPAAPQDAKTLLAAAEKAMGAANLKSIAYSGAGSNAGIGQNRNPAADWPLVRVQSYNREIDFAAPASRVQMVRVQNGAEQKQDQTIPANAPWAHSMTSAVAVRVL